MIFRPARHIDTPEMVDILVERTPDSRYAGRLNVDVPYTRKLISGAIQRHGGTNDGSTFVMVAEGDEGRIEAFVMGVLGRVYLIFDALAAQDYLLINRKACSPRVLDRLFDEYAAWAATNPRVFEIGGTWTDIIPGSNRFDAVFRRKGFERTGAIWRRETRPIEQEIAA